jgi:O-antigen/teichoic acid export membrane protein
VASPAHFIRSVLTLGVSQVLSWVSAIALAVLLPRYLGDANLGKLAFALACTELVGLLADLGGATFLTREVARQPARAGVLTANALAMRLPLSAVSVGVAVVVIHLTARDASTRQIAYILCGAIILNALGKVVFGSLQGLQRMRPLAIAPLASKLAYAGLAAVVLLGGAGVVEVAAASVAGVALGLVIGGIALVRLVRLRSGLDFAVWRTILLGGLPFFVWQAALVIYGQTDAMILSVLTQDAVVGWYSAAYRIVTIPLFMPTIIMTVVFPALSAATSDPRAFSAIAQRALRVVLLASTPIVIGIMLLPDRLLDRLGYPGGFANSVVPIVLLAPHILLVGVDMVIGTVLNTRDRQRQWALTGVAAAVLNPSLNFMLIPLAQTRLGNGAIGAATVTTLTELFMLVVGLRLLPKGVFDRTTVAGLLRCAAAALALTVVVLATRQFPLAVPVLLGAVAYGAGCLASGAISVGELRQVQLSLLTRRQPATASL